MEGVLGTCSARNCLFCSPTHPRTSFGNGALLPCSSSPWDIVKARPRLCLAALCRCRAPPMSQNTAYTIAIYPKRKDTTLYNRLFVCGNNRASQLPASSEPRRRCHLAQR